MIRSLCAVTLGWLVLTAASMSSVTPRHLRLERSVPAQDTTIAHSPEAIRLWFNQTPQAPVSRISLRQDDADIEIGETRPAGDRSLEATLGSPLRPGRYTVHWRTAGDDGHVLRGTFEFTIGETDARP